MKALLAGTAVLTVLSLAAAPSPAVEGEFLLASAALEQAATQLPSPARPYGRLANSANAQDELLELLDDRDPAVRAQAAKALKHYVVTDSRVQRKLLELLDRRGEPDLVRREALKSLSWAAQNYDVQQALLETARSRDWQVSVDLRAVAFKSLYAVARNYQIAEALTQTLEDDRAPLQVRMGAAWALFAAAVDHAPKQALLEAARDKRETEFLRLEALKSLAGQLADYQVKEAVLALAKDSSERLWLREAAILSLVMVNQDYQAKSYLDEAVRSEPNPVLRQAAIKAMGGLTMELARYFHLAWYNGRFIDPLEDQ